jgi:kynurenine formamidase
MPGLSAAACKYFADAGVKAIGSDTAVCDECMIDGQLKQNFGHMKYFLPNHTFIIDGLRNLEKAPTIGMFIALTLKIKGGSGSLIRPIIFG